MAVDYTSHVEGLAQAYGIEIVERVSGGGMAYPGLKRIHIRPARGPVSYAVALHELGHCVDPEAQGRKFSRLHKEYRAWVWAKANALVWTDRMDSEMQRSMLVYLGRASRRGWPVPAYIHHLVEA